MDWYKSHTAYDIFYTLLDPSGKRRAVIQGSGKEWAWCAVLYISEHRIAEQLGEAVSAQSAKEDVIRWFTEVETDADRAETGRA